MNKIDLSGRHAVVTGAAQGFGLAITDRLLASDAKVSMWDIDGDELSGAAGSRDGATAVQGDVTDPASIDAGLKASRAANGPVDILVNNAGGILGLKDFLEVDESAWTETHRLNIQAPFFLAQQAFANMKKHGGGKIINISSVIGQIGNSGQSLSLIHI